MYPFVNLTVMFDALRRLYTDVRNQAGRPQSARTPRPGTGPAMPELPAEACTELRLALSDAPVARPARRAA